MKIHLLGETASPVLLFAQEELSSYLTRMGLPALDITLGVQDLAFAGLPAPADPAADDQYVIEVSPEGGRILGSNERSVLLGVYRYLTLIGCAFLRPGKEFEVVPLQKDPAAFAARETHASSLRHRGVCIEGSTSVDDILNFIDWLPKVGYNSFFLQFEYPHTFLERFYADGNNSLRPDIDWTYADSARVLPAFDEAMIKRGILQHRMGHGWTAKALGSDALGWDVDTREFSEQETARMALLNGKRELYYGVPSNTNLCMSNPDALEAYANAVVDYVKANPSCSYLHLWLADDTNNTCECEECLKLRHSDHYIRLLNLVDEKLTAIGSPVHLVMLLYVDLLWAPKVNRLNNPDRFVLMFAPITRTFEKSFDEVTADPAEPEYKANHLTFPRHLEAYLRFLEDWEEATDHCDAFDYDYYLARAEFGDPTHYHIASLIARDFKQHKNLGMNGISSCQNLRNHMPNGLSGYVMARFAEDTSLDFDQVAEEYYTACYGKDGLKVLDLMKKISACFKQDFIIYAIPETVPDYPAMLAKVPALLDEMTALAAEHAPCLAPAQEHMWEELSFFIDYTRCYARICSVRSEGNIKEAADLFDGEFVPLLEKYELTDPGSIDIWRLVHVAGANIKRGL